MTPSNFEGNITHGQCGAVGTRAFTLYPTNNAAGEVGHTDANKVAFQPSGYCARGNNGRAETFKNQ
jgi:hypothetical protein